MGWRFTRRTMMRVASALALAVPAARALASGPQAAVAPWRWAVDYGAAPDPLLARACDLLVLEPGHGHDLAALRGPATQMIGYVSLAEIERARPYAAAMARAGVLLAPNPDWPDARFADLRHPAWRAALLEQIIPAILARGYDGLFYDTLDSAEALERADPAGNAGMIAAAATLLADIRAAYPQAVLVMNRGYGLLPASARHVDYLLGEAMGTRWSFARQCYEQLSAADFGWQAAQMEAARAAHPGLRLLTLDYWDQADRAMVSRLYQERRALGYLPYVSTLALDRIWPEPAA